ncbi:MAG TPA: 1-phosphofructokinase [Accumulibacter sp.]|uniref:1-phosphofructokinase n=1 Tax=Accumulibacter sp. TaxID=2053492 RepID=UPI00287A326A|nr:1-phosphofructokinase [Accumulibacter sp.]MDS4054310.1 1-phosphofructokinase [Accumulibacter sp.]HMV06407.1 1-phosphofructokinase [Accumulibacter sp.]HMW63657.1 1-phosphofructokinase [Accumulibacter sp.]HMW81653.1 1-phosphofructokinase [Accumulibacter sp.]HNB69303.1 1-phosphofructokinase [Accumulibacter sp.]
MGRTPGVFTLTLNPAVDHSIGLPQLLPGGLNRVAWEKATAGGKGVNVASFLADLGCCVTAGGLLGADNADLFDRVFLDRGIADAFVRLPGRTRVNLKLIEENSATVTEINFPGQAVAAAHLADLQHRIDAALAGCAYCIASGSLPAGVRVEYYADLIARLATTGQRVLLDTSGQALRCGVAAHPWAIKPNQAELEELVGRRLPDCAALGAAARTIVEQGVHLVIVSLGGHGALFVNANRCLHASALAVPVRTTVGAGDALVAGFIAGCLRGLADDGCARLATAVAAAALGVAGARLPGEESIEALMARVELRELPPGE